MLTVYTTPDEKAQRDEEIIKSFQEGVARQKIADGLNISRQTVQRIIREYRSNLV